MPGVKPLSHIVYQPKNLYWESSRFLTNCFHKIIREGDAYLAVLPGKGTDEQNVRTYLLEPERRREFLRGDNYKMIHGLDSLQDEMLDKRMLVLHYKYHEDFVLLPCLVKTGDHEGNYDAIKSMEESDILIGMLVRKGTNKDHGPSLNVRYVISLRRTVFPKTNTRAQVGPLCARARFMASIVSEEAKRTEIYSAACRGQDACLFQKMERHDSTEV